MRPCLQIYKQQQTGKGIHSSIIHLCGLKAFLSLRNFVLGQNSSNRIIPTPKNYLPFPFPRAQATQGNHLFHPPAPPSTDSWPPPSLGESKLQCSEVTYLSTVCTYHRSAEGPAFLLTWILIASPESSRSPKETSTQHSWTLRPRQQPGTMG